MFDKHGFVVVTNDSGLVVNGMPISWPNHKRSGHSICQSDGLYVDGYEWKNGVWKRTLKAIIKCM